MSYKHVPVPGTPELQAKDPFLMVVPVVAQTSGHGLQFSALSAQARSLNTILKSYWYYREFMSYDL